MSRIDFEMVPQESEMGVWILLLGFLLFSRLKNFNNEHLKNCWKAHTSKKCTLGY